MAPQLLGLAVVVSAATAPVTVAPATAIAASIVAASVVVAAASPSAVPSADGPSLLAIHSGRLSMSRLAAALANVNAPWLVAAGVSTITATASAVGPLCVAVGPELPATHASDILDVGILGYVHVPRPLLRATTATGSAALGHPLGRWKR
jgi:hypothetical protein